MGRGGVGSTRSEFLAEPSVEDVRFHRNGGCFVTTKRAIGFVLFAILSLFLVILMMYYYGPSRKLEQLENEMKDIEELINSTLNDGEQVDIRLPKNLEPLHYRLKIFPILDEYDPNNFTYNAYLTITIYCKEATNKIILNIDDLVIAEQNVTITTLEKVVIESDLLTQTDVILNDDRDKYNTTVEDGDNEQTFNTTNRNFTAKKDSFVSFESVPLAVSQIYQEELKSQLIIVMKKDLLANTNFTLDIKFSANISHNLAGFYKTSYMDSTGQKRWLATTYFPPIFARKAFPCFDEPNFKSTFEISIARRTNMTALSNMPLKETEPIPYALGWVWDHFETSLPMPTYLVSFTIFDFHKVQSPPNQSGPLINIWVPEPEISKAKYSLEQTRHILNFLEIYLDIKYPLPKIDLLAIPNFVRGAVGSWGILSFRKSSVLIDENTRSWEAKQKVFITLAHELAHQWFGNLVTMKWWNDLWLNEGVGSFMAEVVQTSLRPNWQTSNDFPLRVMYDSFELDSLKSTRSIQNDVTKTSQIEQIYDSIIPSKSTSLIRMLNYTLTRPVFRQGLQYYLKSLSYKSTDQDTLWESLTEIARNHSVLPVNITVKMFMESWTKQKGYPCVIVNRNYETGQANITQMIFIQENVNNETLWYIPLSYATTDDILKTAWLLKEREVVMNITSPGNSSWVLFNIDQAGYFRVNYDPHNWDLLIQQLHRNPEDIPIASRGQLLDDAFELAKLEIINYSIPLRLTKYLRWRENNYVPWLTVISNLEELRFIINNYEYTGIYEKFLMTLIKHKLDNLGTTEKLTELQNDKILRWRLLQVACDLRYELCVKWAQDEFGKWMQMAEPDNKNPILYQYRSTILCTAIKTGNRREWDFLWERTKSPLISPVDLKTAYLSLGCTHDPWVINKYLELSLSGNISIEYIPLVWKSINHPVGIRTGFHFLRLNWDRIFETYEDVYLVLASICQDFLTHLSTEIDLQDLTQFYKLHQKDFKQVAGFMQAAVDLIKLRIHWREMHLDTVVNWLKTDIEEW